MTFFTPDIIERETGGTWLRRPQRRNPLSGIGIDSRQSLVHKVFIAIQGPRHDGHDYLEAAVQQGAALLVVHREPDEPLREGPCILLVSDTRRALGDLARAYRRTLSSTTVVAVTGSAGKTTTKSLIHGVLSRSLRGTSAPKSFNNDIGVPLTVLSASPDDAYLVLEIGTSAPGEIAQLAAIAAPDLAIITMVGRSHLAGLGSVQGVAREKASIVAHLQPHGVAIINGDSALLRSAIDTYALQHVVTFGRTSDATLRLTDHGRDADGSWIELNHAGRFRLGLPGEHNAVNSLAAIAVGRHFGLDDAAISAGLAAARPTDMRMMPQHIGDVTVYNDAYNANPDSMIAALQTFTELTADAPRRVVILGDMLELGSESEALHRDVGRHLAFLDAACRFERVILVGPEAAHMADGMPAELLERVCRVPSLDADDAICRVRSMVKPGDSVLLKGSRGCALERIFNDMPVTAHG